MNPHDVDDEQEYKHNIKMSRDLKAGEGESGTFRKGRVINTGGNWLGGSPFPHSTYTSSRLFSTSASLTQNSLMQMQAGESGIHHYCTQAFSTVRFHTEHSRLNVFKSISSLPAQFPSAMQWLFSICP